MHILLLSVGILQTLVFRQVYAKRPHKPAGDTELSGQAVHAPVPGESLYFPSSHAVQVPPLGPVYPALHVQSPLASLPAFTCVQMHTPT